MEYVPNEKKKPFLCEAAHVQARLAHECHFQFLFQVILFAGNLIERIRDQIRASNIQIEKEDINVRDLLMDGSIEQAPLQDKNGTQAVNWDSPSCF